MTNTQTKAKHTPGPWRVGLAHGIKGVYNVDVPETITSEEDHANARLIAATPELLKACKKAVELIKHDYFIEGEEICKRIGLIQAIAKAES